MTWLTLWLLCSLFSLGNSRGLISTGNEFQARNQHLGSNVSPRSIRSQTSPSRRSPQQLLLRGKQKIKNEQLHPSSAGKLGHSVYNKSTRNSDARKSQQTTVVNNKERQRQQTTSIRNNAIMLTSDSKHLLQPFIDNNTTFVVFSQLDRSQIQYEYVVEIASKFNPVIVISDFPAVENHSNKQSKLKHQSYDDYMEAQPVFQVHFNDIESERTKSFDKWYKAVNLEGDMKARRDYEKFCIQRWLYVNDLCAVFNISHIFYADTDVVVFSNLTTAFSERNKERNCDVEVGVPGTYARTKDSLYVASGHSSFWSATALRDFSDFIFNLYNSRVYLHSITHPKEKVALNRVTDMTVLFTYWIAHHMNDSYIDAGMPQYLYETHSHERKTITQRREMLSSDQHAFKKKIDFARKLVFPPVNNQLRVCNILDVVENSTFDYKSMFENKHFSLNLDLTDNDCSSSISIDSMMCNRERQHTYLLPYILSDVLANNMGGHGQLFSESDYDGNNNGITAATTPVFKTTTTKTDIKQSSARMVRIYTHTIHFQGFDKKYVKFDVCSRLVSCAHLQQLLHSFQQRYGKDCGGNKSCVTKRDDMQKMLDYVAPGVNASVSSVGLNVFHEYMLNMVEMETIRLACKQLIESGVKDRYNSVESYKYTQAW